MRIIHITQGFTAMVDDDDFDIVSQFRWYILKCNDGRKYALTSVYKPEKHTVRMHQLIMSFPDGIIDHINHNGLDNQKSNLRVCTPRQNSQNSLGRPSYRISRFKGVNFEKHINRWRSRIVVDNRKLSLGVFETEVEAGLAYDAAAKRHYGEFAYLNFP